MWLRAGDRNTRYFHAVSRGKRIKSTLSSIQDDNGVIHRGHSNIAKVAESYFNNFFASQNDLTNHFHNVFHGFNERVSEDIQI